MLYRMCLEILSLLSLSSGSLYIRNNMLFDELLHYDLYCLCDCFVHAEFAKNDYTTYYFPFSSFFLRTSLWIKYRLEGKLLPLTKYIYIYYWLGLALCFSSSNHFNNENEKEVSRISDGNSHFLFFSFALLQLNNRFWDDWVIETNTEKKEEKEIIEYRSAWHVEQKHIDTS